MAVDPDPILPAPAEEPDEAERQRKREKKARKVRSAWIAFFGRIAAQVIGATATVALGLMIAKRVPFPEYRERPAVVPSALPTVLASDRPRPRGDAVSVAVLPLENYSGDPAQDFFADGMTEALIADLARIPALRVISRTSAMQYKHARKPLPQIARELGVDVAIEGSVVLAGKRARVTAQLVSAADDRHLWAESYERETRDILAVQRDIAQRVAREVERVLRTEDQLFLSPSPLF